MIKVKYYEQTFDSHIVIVGKHALLGVYVIHLFDLYPAGIIIDGLGTGDIAWCSVTYDSWCGRANFMGN